MQRTQNKTMPVFFIRYFISGAFGAGVQVALLYIWVDGLHLQTLYLLGSVLSFLVATAVAFILQRYWTFKDRIHARAHRQFFTYMVISVAGLAVNTGLLFAAKNIFEMLQINFFHKWYLVVQVAIVGVVAIMNFIVNNLITFKDVSSTYES